MNATLTAARPAVRVDAGLRTELPVAVNDAAHLVEPTPGLESLLRVGDTEILPEDRRCYAGEFLRSHTLLMPYARHSLALKGLNQVDKPEDFVALKRTIENTQPTWYQHLLSIKDLDSNTGLLVVSGAILGGVLVADQAQYFSEVALHGILGGLVGYLPALVMRISGNTSIANRCARALDDLTSAETALSKALDSPDFTDGFFAAHPEELKPFLTEFIPYKLTAKKGMIESEIRALDVDIAQLAADRDNPKLAEAPADFRATVIKDNTLSLAALRTARDKLQNVTLTALELLLKRVPEAAVKVEAWLQKRANAEELVTIATRAARGQDRADTAAKFRLAIEQELADLVAETSSIVTQAVALHRAHTATELEMARFRAIGENATVTRSSP